MYWLKSCPRCHGDLCEEQDALGKFVKCIQCGHMLTVAQEDELRFGKKTAAAIAAKTADHDLPMVVGGAQ